MPNQQRCFDKGFHTLRGREGHRIDGTVKQEDSGGLSPPRAFCVVFLRTFHICIFGSSALAKKRLAPFFRRHEEPSNQPVPVRSVRVGFAWTPRLYKKVPPWRRTRDARSSQVVPSVLFGACQRHFCLSLFFLSTFRFIFSSLASASSFFLPQIVLGA